MPRNIFGLRISRPNTFPRRRSRESIYPGNTWTRSIGDAFGFFADAAELSGKLERLGDKSFVPVAQCEVFLSRAERQITRGLIA